MHGCKHFSDFIIANYLLILVNFKDVVENVL